MGAREAVTGSLDVTATLKRRDEVIHDLDDSSQLPWLESNGVTLIRGEAKVTGERTVEVGVETLEARKAVIIATGTRASIPPIEGLADADPWTNREVTTAKRVPESMVLIGAGVVGVEMAQAYATLGVNVTLIEAAPQILGREEPFAAEQVRAGLQGAGVTVHERIAATAVHRRGDGGVTVETDGAVRLAKGKAGIIRDGKTVRIAQQVRFSDELVGRKLEVEVEATDLQGRRQTVSGAASLEVR